MLGPFGAGPEPAVDRQVGVHQEDGERLVEVVLEVGQVERVGLDDPDADVLVEQVADDRVAAGDVVVELLARLARDAAEDDEQRLVRRLGGPDALVQVVVDPVLSTPRRPSDRCGPSCRDPAPGGGPPATIAKPRARSARWSCASSNALNESTSSNL